jgi:hypothetical protein
VPLQNRWTTPQPSFMYTDPAIPQMIPTPVVVTPAPVEDTLDATVFGNTRPPLRRVFPYSREFSG